MNLRRRSGSVLRIYSKRGLVESSEVEIISMDIDG